jgi:hypothetical protein
MKPTMFAKAVLKWESRRMWVLKAKRQEKLQIPLGLLATCITRIRPICGKVPFTADRGEYKNETYLLAILPHILNT